MSEQFLTHLLSYIAAIVVLAIVLKLSFQSFLDKTLVKSRLVRAKGQVLTGGFSSDSEDQLESVKRLCICCNYIIMVGVVMFMLMYISYVFNLFDTVPSSMMN